MTDFAAGTDQEIVWQRTTQTYLNPDSQQVPRQAKSITPETVAGEFAGKYFAKWWLTPKNGITVEAVQYMEDSNPVSHSVADYMQWRNLRLVFPDDQDSELPFTLTPKDCKWVSFLSGGGRRTRDGKKFSWGCGAKFERLVGHFKIVVEQAFLFGEPEADQEPTASIVALKVFPLLLTTILRTQTSDATAPDFAADMKVIVAPRLTRANQHRPVLDHKNNGTVTPVDCYQPQSRKEDIVVSMFCDTNTPEHVIGSGLDPHPKWHVVFDYVETDMQEAKAIQAVVYPRSKVKELPFVVGPHTLRRALGQGQFDNIHIHPYVGFDDPRDANPDGTIQDRAMIEAPIGADEVVHLHWRWGEKIPAATRVANVNKPPDQQVRPSLFQGYSDLSAGNLPNQVDGRPLIPANQSLRIKVAPAQPVTGDDADEPAPGTKLDRSRAAIWYAARVHDPGYRMQTMFFGHGFGLAFFFKPQSPFGIVGPTINNDDLLGAPFAVPCYHTLRWDMSGTQRVPTASQKPGLEMNRIGVGSPPLDEDSIP